QQHRRNPSSGLTGSQQARLSSLARDLACMNGLLLKDNPASSSSGSAAPDRCMMAPITLVPSSFSKEAFNQAVELQALFNSLYHRVSRDHNFLCRVIPPAAESDSFLSALWDMYQTVRQSGADQPITLALNRADYMLDEEAGLKQVEINLMASSFGGLAQRLSTVHRQVMSAAGVSERQLAHRLPDNRPAETFGEAFIQAFKLYGRPEAAILFVVSPDERNIFDQRTLEAEIYAADASSDSPVHVPQILRRSFDQIASSARLEESSGRLYLADQEVAIVYYRHGYSPDHFSDPAGVAWSAKLLMERSRAIKCPSLAYMLANTKAVQAALCEPGAVARYLPGKSAKVEATFVDQCVLSDSRAHRWLLADPEDFVLKPQREGGGNNIYGRDVVDFASRLTTRQSAAYILMRRIRPQQQVSLMLKADQRLSRRPEMPLCVSAISELGIYGALVAKNNSERLNCSAGHVLRTKSAFTDEGGVATGFSCIDTVYLV
uniref:Glutathione synthetase n=2 Tax=Macrostomum lignano TaxID=282301 RepID=A0A1I8H5Z9_9PLAT